MAILRNGPHSLYFAGCMSLCHMKRNRPAPLLSFGLRTHVRLCSSIVSCRPPVSVPRACQSVKPGLVDVPISVQKFCQETIEPMGAHARARTSLYACSGSSSCPCSALPLNVLSLLCCVPRAPRSGNESDHIEAHALTDALGVAVRVVYLDRTRHIGACTHRAGHPRGAPVREIVMQGDDTRSATSGRE